MTVGDWYYVSYNVGHQGGVIIGNVEMELPGPPRPGGDDVRAMASRIGRLAYERGMLPAGAEVSVLAWSRMAD